MILRTIGLLLLMMSFLFPPATAHADAAKKVKQGIAHFRAEEFKKAANAFTEADVAKPDSDPITFDRACAYAAQGDTEKAAELFRTAALSRDTRLAVRSHYNLGGLAAARARAVFGEKPQEATPEVRAEGLQLLQAAVGHYRDCIDLDADHAEARHNLELIRLWIKQMEDLWRQRDRQEQRDEMDLLAFLRMLETQERTLRETARSLADQPDSPRRRQAFSATGTAQRELSQEIEPLKEKIAAIGQPAQPAQPARPPGGALGAGGQPGLSSAPPPPPDESTAEAISILTRLADDVGQAMQDAAGKLNGGSVDDAVVRQADAVTGLDQIYTAVVPFADMVTRGVATQEELVNRVSPVAEPGDEQNAEAIDAETEDETGDGANRPTFDASEFDAPESAWGQRFVAGWGEVLPAKAEHGISNLAAVDPAAMGTMPGMAGQTPQQPPDPEAAQKQQEQLDQLKAAMEKAVKLGPEIHALAQAASDHLEKEELAHALPKQEQALKLWQEIADLLPKQDQQEECEEPNEEENQDDRQQDQEQSDDSQQQQQQPKPQDRSKQEAESVLRKAREQEKKRRDLEKEVQQYLFRAHAVERDW